MPKPRIVLGDDHSLILEGLRSVLQNDFEIAGIATNGRELVEIAERLKPDAVVLDISMPLLNGMEAARQIRKTIPATKLLFVTQKSEREYVKAALQMGASGYILKQSLVSELVPALREVLNGRFYITPDLRNGLPGIWHSTQNPSELFATELTPRQREILQLVAEGKSNKEIAALLSISIKTVDFHKAAIMDELGIRSTAELTRYALRQGISGE